MNGSDLNGLLETRYGPNLLDHVMNGKAVIHAYFLPAAAIMNEKAL